MTALPPTPICQLHPSVGMIPLKGLFFVRKFPLKSFSVQNLAFHPVIFDVLDGSAIRLAALHTSGAVILQDLMLMDGDVCVLLFREPQITYVKAWF